MDVSSMNQYSPPLKANKISIIFKYIPSGSFKMGSEDHLYTIPIHDVVITNPFYMSVYPVTQQQWVEVMNTNPSHYQDPDKPVEKISFDEIMEFIHKMNEIDENSYRLPTEAEWEYACRAGSSSKYFFGDDQDGLDDYVWYSANTKTGSNRQTQTQKVGLKKPNSFGLYDMLGNVSEYCSDYFDEEYYSISPKKDPIGPFTGDQHVLRGGNFNYPKNPFNKETNKLITCAGRMTYHNFTSKKDRGHGFRLVMNIE